ncbi:hypothetical protein ACO2Q0_00115 [Phenylobacterium sp. VNQ135]|uniref:hypothetical protein n=1 Tax=Phenylobacterium sp. VNQ135 TaxID=3400922 RepID=UPI003BFC7A09
MRTDYLGAMTAAKHLLATTASIGLMTASAATPAWAQAQASVVTQGSVTIVDPPALAKGAEISVDPVSRPRAGGVTARAVSGRYEVSGVAGDSYSLAIPSSLKLMRTDGAGEVLLQLSPAGAVSSLPGTYGARASGSVAVQGAVGVDAGAAAGVYKGSFPVILSLQ